MIDVVRDFVCEVIQLPKICGKAFAFVALALLFVSKSEAQLTNPRGRPQLNATRTTFVARNSTWS